MEFDGYLRFILALAFVLALIGVLAWLARRFGPGSSGLRRNGNGKRLALVEAMPLDGRRRLVLLRRDDVEHLLVLGVNSELVVEGAIAAPARAANKARPAAPAAKPPPAKKPAAKGKAAARASGAGRGAGNKRTAGGPA